MIIDVVHMGKVLLRGDKIGTRINRACTKYQKQLGVKIMYVHKNGKCNLK